MNEDKLVYDYIVNSISSTLNNGIDYYSNKNSLIVNRLKETLKFVNEPILFLNEIEELNTNKLYDEAINPELHKEVEEMINLFINKLSSIKISILNLEDNVSCLKESMSNSIDSSLKIEDIEEG